MTLCFTQRGVAGLAQLIIHASLILCEPAHLYQKGRQSKRPPPFPSENVKRLPRLLGAEGAQRRASHVSVGALQGQGSTKATVLGFIMGAIL